MFGAHLSTSESVNNLQLIAGTNLPVVQLMFPTNPSKTQQIALKSGFEASVIKYLVIHAPYQINLAQSPTSPTGQASYRQLVEQLALGASLSEGLKDKKVYVVFHVGKSLQLEVKKAEEYFCQQLIQAINQIPPNVTLLLETPAGQGTELFTDFDYFLEIYQTVSSAVKTPEQFGICLDTCHVFSAGYNPIDLLNKASRMQVNPIRLIHLNDSQTVINSRVDRHASIGRGYIFNKESGGSPNLLTDIVKWSTRYSVPVLLETDPNFYQIEIDRLYQISSGNQTMHFEICKSSSEISELEASISQSTVFPTNLKIVNIFEILAQVEQNRFKKAALIKAIETVKSLDFNIETRAQVSKYSGIGKGIGDRIEEILKTGTLLEYEQQRDELDAVSNLTQISGIGPVKAKELYSEHGIKTVKQLGQAVEKGEVKLTKAQSSGLKYHFDIEQRIPRSEIDRFNQIIRDVCHSIDKQLESCIVGSYRRGLADSGDIDVLFVHPKLTTLEEVHASGFLDQILDRMRSLKMIDSILSQGHNKVMLIGHLPDSSISRRIDFLLTPTASYAASLMYFTGSKTFNVLCRNRAISKRMKLNEYGLFDKDGIQLPTPSEQSIFSYLELKYLTPVERNIDPSVKSLPTRVDVEIEVEPEDPVEKLKRMGLKELKLILDLKQRGNEKRDKLIKEMRKILTDAIAPNPEDRARLINMAIEKLEGSG